MCMQADTHTSTTREHHCFIISSLISGALSLAIQHHGLDGYTDAVVDQMSNENHSAEDSVYHWFHSHPHQGRQVLVTGQHHLNQGGFKKKQSLGF